MPPCQNSFLKYLNNQPGYITFQENSWIASFLLHDIYHKAGNTEEMQNISIIRHQVLDAKQQFGRATGSDYKV